MIGENIQVKVVEVRGQQVRIGIEAPSEVTVAREELHREVAATNREATKARKDNITALASMLREERKGRKESP